MMMMTTKYEQLYDELLTELNKCIAFRKTEMIENCYWICCKYWNAVKENTDETIFETEQNEIDFFKRIKPRFTSLIEYYIILAEVNLFIPMDTESQIIYWRDEMKRYWRFCDKNKAFVEYYENKHVYLDSTYFVRVSSDWVPGQQPAIYDADKRYCSSHDYLVRGLLAQKKYFDYVKGKVEELEREG